MPFIRYLILAILIYFVVRMIYKFFFQVPNRMNRLLDEKEEENRRSSSKKRGKGINIDDAPSQKTRFKKDDGEYIDYEEVK